MPPINDIIDKIYSDSEGMVNSMLELAAVDARKILDARLNEAKARRAEILENAEKECEIIKLRVAAENELYIRDLRIAAKRGFADKVLETAKKRFSELNADEFADFVRRQIKDIAIDDGDELLIPDKYKSSTFSIKIYDGERKLDGGFVLIKKDYEYDCTIDALFQYHADEIERMILESLE